MITAKKGFRRDIEYFLVFAQGSYKMATDTYDIMLSFYAGTLIKEFNK